MSYLVRDYNLEAVEDAARLAAMFNDFDSAWPGGFTRGLDETPEQVQERMRHRRRQAVLVAVSEEGEFVGYCDLEAQVGQREVAYIDLLGARLSHHGRGVGKMLLREMVRRVTDLGYRQVTLGTWPGNTKAVPLYKKTGFHWEPDTNVFMRNYLPSALTTPVGRAFFASRDWYACLDRAIEIAPDDVKWNGMKVFPYRFRDGDETLDLIFDAYGHGLTSIETPDYRVSCFLSAEEAPAGEVLPITWEIISKRGRPLPVTLLAEAEAGLHLRAQEQFTVEGEHRLTRDLHVDPLTAPRHGGEPAHRVHSTLILDGVPLTLETGVKVVRPVEIHYSGEALSVGRDLRFEAVLKSNLDRLLTGRVTLSPHPLLSCNAPVQEFTLAPRMETQTVFTVRASEAGALTTRLQVAAGDVRSERPVLFRALEGSGAQGGVDAQYNEEAVLENQSLRASVHLRGGGLSLHAPTRNRWMMWQGLGELGPPFVSHRMIEPMLEARIETGASDRRLVVTSPSPEFPGLTVERTLTLLSDGLAQIDLRVYNMADTPQTISLRVRSHGDFNHTLISPLPQGLIREPLHEWGEFPSGDIDLLAHGAKLTENWHALEEDELVGGIIWMGDPEIDFQWSRFPHLRYELGELPPNSVRELPPIYLFAGEGDWKTVRRWYRRLTQSDQPPEMQSPEPVRVLEVRIDPAHALLCSGEATVPIEIMNRRGRALNGVLRLKSGDFHTEIEEIPVEAANRDKAHNVELKVSSPDRLGAGFLEATLEAGPTVERFRLPLVRGGMEGAVAVRETEPGLYAIENGHMTLKAAPGFFGALVALERDGVNHLYSAWPAARPMSWFNPWHGGVHAMVWNGGDEQLAREVFTGGPIERTGARGLHWQGVRARCEPQHKDWRWLHLELEYLTLPGSNLIALVTRWTNHDGARSRPGGGAQVWVQPGGVRENLTLHWEREGERRERRRGGFQMHGSNSPWAAAENSATHDALLLVPTAYKATAGVGDMGADGASLIVGGPVSLEPGETKEVLNWLVLLQGVDQVDAYVAALSKIRRLP